MRASKRRSHWQKIFPRKVFVRLTPRRLYQIYLGRRTSENAKLPPLPCDHQAIPSAAMPKSAASRPPWRWHT